MIRIPNIFTQRPRRPHLVDHRDTVSTVGGFTLVETLVAITIVMVTLTATYSALTTGVRSTVHSRNTITAFYLAQEAFEFTKNRRDFDSLSDDDEVSWDDELSGECQGSGCVIDIFNDEGQLHERWGQGEGDLRLISCSDTDLDCPAQLYKHSSSDVYDNVFTEDVDDEDWQRTPFWRSVQYEPVGGAGEEARIIVTVEWDTSRGERRRLTLREHLYNWR